MIGIELQEISLYSDNVNIGIELSEISFYETTRGIQLVGFTIEKEPDVEEQIVKTNLEKPKKDEVVSNEQTNYEDIDIDDYINGNVNKKYLVLVQETLDTLPYIKGYLEENNWKIVCKKEKVNGANSGVIDYKKKVIELFATDNISEYFVHECGHLFDFMLQYTLDNESFTKLYEEEVDKLLEIEGVEKVNTRNEREYFAECFRLYYEGNESFKALKSYKLMKGLIKDEEK